MRRDPTEFRERFKAYKEGKKPYENGLPVYNFVDSDEPSYKNGKLPGYRGGKVNLLHNPTNATTNNDGSYSDDYTKIFDDFYVTPSGIKTKYGSYTDKNWNRYKKYKNYLRYRDLSTGKIKGEPGLELIFPEFDAISIMRGISNAIPKRKSVYSLTDNEWDLMYNAAIKSGDKQKILLIRDLHFVAKSNGNKAVDANRYPVKTYHTVGDSYDPSFNEFNPNIEGSNSAIYASNDPLMSGTYSSKLVSDFEKESLAEAMRINEIKNIESGYAQGGSAELRKAILLNPERGRDWIVRNTWLNLDILPARLKQLYIKLTNPVEISNGGRPWNNLDLTEISKYPDIFKRIRPNGLLSNGYSTRSLEEALRQSGIYDGAIIRDVVDYGGSRKSSVLNWWRPSDVYMVNSPKNLKLADPITYDDAGNIVPISKRDNFNISDLRYSILPVGTIGYGLNQYKDGKSPIQIKPHNRGKLTRLKKRTGKSESELYNDGNPAHKKMVVFARNARKWSHK